MEYNFIRSPALYFRYIVLQGIDIIRAEFLIGIIIVEPLQTVNFLTTH